MRLQNHFLPIYHSAAEGPIWYDGHRDMDVFEEQAAPPAIRRPLPSPQLAAAVLLLAAGVVALLAWGGSDGSGTTAGIVPGTPAFRYVNSGWVSPLDWEEAGPFAMELRAFVIGSQEELDAFEGGFISKRIYGNTTTLDRIEFDSAALLAAYYVWRPVRGDPLSVADVQVDEVRAVVKMELDENPQGREYPYLFAPMIMVAVERSLFPEGEPVEFVFELNGEAEVTQTATPNPAAPSS